MKKIMTLVFSFVLALLSSAQELSKTVALSLVYENSVALNINVSKDNIPQISNAYTDESFGLTYLYLQQAYRNIKVYNSIKTLVFKKNVLQSNFGDFVQDIALKANSETPKIKAVEAIKIAAKHLDLINNYELKELENTFDTNKRIIFRKVKLKKKILKQN